MEFIDAVDKHVQEVFARCTHKMAQCWQMVSTWQPHSH